MSPVTKVAVLVSLHKHSVIAVDPAIEVEPVGHEEQASEEAEDLVEGSP